MRSGRHPSGGPPGRSSGASMSCDTWPPSPSTPPLPDPSPTSRRCRGEPCHRLTGIPFISTCGGRSGRSFGSWPTQTSPGSRAGSRRSRSCSSSHYGADETGGDGNATPLVHSTRREDSQPSFVGDLRENGASGREVWPRVGLCVRQHSSPRRRGAIPASTRPTPSATPSPRRSATTRRRSRCSGRHPHCRPSADSPCSRCP